VIAIVDFLVNAVEFTFLYCLMDNIDSSFPFTVRSIDDSALDPNCPIKYRVEPYIVIPQDNSIKQNIKPVASSDPGETQDTKS
jgi:hypothetical protein